MNGLFQCGGGGQGAFGSLSALLKTFNGTDATKGLGSVGCFVQAIIGMALDLAAINAVIMILYSAFLFVTSFGDDTKVETAKKTLLWSIVGLIVIALCYTIIAIIQSEVFTK